jgi:peptidyl-prolyl cis-trans isomerase SurA
MYKNILITLLLLGAGTALSYAQQGTSVVSDKIVAVVNDHIILKSDVDARTAEYLQSARGMSFSEELWFDVLESLVDNFVMVEKATIDSIVVTDDEVNRQLDQRIRALVQQTGSEANLERALGKSIVQIRVEFRDQFRREIMTERLRQTKQQTVRITRPEVEKFFNAIPTDSLPTIPTTVQLAQIISIPPHKAEAQNAALQKAVAIRDSIVNQGKEFEAMARYYGEDGTAAQGGILPLMPMSDLVPEYSAAAAALSPGEVSEVVRTPFGYHVIRLNRRVADQIETNHILIRVGDEEIDDDFSINKLTSVRDSILTHDISFATMARRHSDDKTTAPSGGRIVNLQTGERQLVLESMEPALFRTVSMLEEIGAISEPRPFNTGLGGSQQKAYRIIQLINKTEEHRANLQDDYELLKNFALQQKQMDELQKWVRELRKEVYIEYKIYHPFLSAN